MAVAGCLWKFYDTDDDDDGGQQSPKRKAVDKTEEGEDGENVKRQKVEQPECANSDVIDLQLSNSGAGDAGSDEDVLNELVSAPKDSSTVDLAGLGVLAALPAVPKRGTPGKPRSSDPALLESRQRNMLAHARLHQAAHQQQSESTEKEDSPEPQDDARYPGGNGTARGTPDSPASPAGYKADDKVTLKLVNKKKKELPMRISMQDPLSKLFTKYHELAVQKGWVTPKSKLKFLFDGDPLLGSDTAAGKEMEDGDAIDVQMS